MRKNAKKVEKTPVNGLKKAFLEAGTVSWTVKVCIWGTKRISSSLNNPATVGIGFRANRNLNLIFCLEERILISVNRNFLGFFKTIIPIDGRRRRTALFNLKV